mmetsp:Transcript_23379/g.41556  ORF Transcript_23379/g.41556 Transcript_23379/m.41556 type:complete len:222 (-) Transcript_23379:606-1271(-)
MGLTQTSAHSVEPPGGRTTWHAAPKPLSSTNGNMTSELARQANTSPAARARRPSASPTSFTCFRISFARFSIISRVIPNASNSSAVAFTPNRFLLVLKLSPLSLFLFWVLPSFSPSPISALSSLLSFSLSFSLSTSMRSSSKVRTTKAKNSRGLSGMATRPLSAGCNKSFHLRTATAPRRLRNLSSRTSTSIAPHRYGAAYTLPSGSKFPWLLRQTNRRIT